MQKRIRRKSRPKEALGYADVAERIRKAIPNKYGPGKKIASERDLAAEFGVNRHTVRHALQQLEAQGLISTVHGSGSIVVRQRLERCVTHNLRFTTSAELAGMSATTEVISVEQALPGAEAKVVKSLVGTAKPTGQIVTVRYLNSVPVAWIRHVIFGRDVRDLAEGFPGGSLHDWIDRKWGIRLRRQETRMSADRASAADIQLLFVPRDLPIFCAKGVNIDAETGELVEVSLSRNRSDAIEFRFEMPDVASG
jgi:GntR family phosphonate transport system transcriptional regulator